MKIDYDYTEIGKDLFDEAQGIYNYVANLKNGRKIKLRKNTENLKITKIASIILLVIGAILSMCAKANIDLILGILFIILGSSFLGMYYILKLNYDTCLKNFMSYPTGNISINKIGVKIKCENRDLSFKWDKFYYLAYSCHVICLITDSNEMIILENKYYEEVYNLVSEFNPKMTVIEL